LWLDLGFALLATFPFLDAKLLMKKYKDAQYLGMNGKVWQNLYVISIFQEM